MEYVIGLTGIGGQGIQLAARSLAEAALIDDKRVQLFASYGGMMRGGNSDSYVVVADDAVDAPPVPARVDATVVMHHAHAADLWGKVGAGGIAVVNSSVVMSADRPATDATVIDVDALDVASALGAPVAASLVAIGVLVARTELVSGEALLETAGRVLPSYRSDAIEVNRSALEAGLELGAAARIEATR